MPGRAGCVGCHFNGASSGTVPSGRVMVKFPRNLMSSEDAPTITVNRPGAAVGIGDVARHLDFTAGAGALRGNFQRTVVELGVTQPVAEGKERALDHAVVAGLRGGLGGKVEGDLAGGLRERDRKFARGIRVTEEHIGQGGLAFALAGRSARGWVFFTGNLWMLVYHFLMLRWLFAQSWFWTIFKTGLLGFAYVMTLAFAFLVTAVILFALA